MFYLFGVIPLLQITAAVHVVKTGRDWNWLWIILFFPLIGTVIYFVVEILPVWRLPRRSLGELTGRAANFALPARELRILQERVEILDSVDNRRALARGYVRAAQPENALALYRRCLQGAFRDDAEITFEFAYALFLAGQLEECRQTLEKLRQDHPGYNASQREVLCARMHENLGCETEALGIYENVITNHRSEEARCRYARLLEKTGNLEKAKALYEDIVKRAKRQDYHYRRVHREWIGFAKEGLQRVTTTTRRDPAQ